MNRAGRLSDSYSAWLIRAAQASGFIQDRSAKVTIAGDTNHDFRP